MMLNVDVIKDFGMLLHAILFNTLTTQDFYHSIRSFYVGLLAHLVKDYSKNNLYINKEIKMRTGEKKRKRETEHYEMQVECLFEKMMKDGNRGFNNEMKVKMVEALREDEREI